MNEFRNDENNKEGVFKRIKASFTGRKFRNGAFVSLITSIVIVLVVVVNLIISEMDLSVDLSKQDYYTLTAETKGVMKDLKDDVTIYLLVESDSASKLFQKIAEKYETLSDHIKFELKDPVLYPKFASQYVDNEVTPNSFLVVNESNNRAKYIDEDELLVKEFNYETYQYSDITGIDVEGKLTSAIQYVTTPDLPVIYATTGHSEVEMGELFKAVLDKQNVTVNTIKTLTEDSIPEDCDMLLINSPERDFNVDEIAMIKDYMAAGGNVVAIVDYMVYDLKNLNSLLNYYGIKMNEGIVCEGDSNMHVANYPHYIVPNILQHDLTQGVSDSKQYVITPLSSGLSILDGSRSSLVVEPILSTSDASYSKVNPTATTFEKEMGDIDGPFYIGLVATDTYNNTSSKLVVYSSELIFDDSSLQSYGNFDLLKSTVSYLSGEVASVSVKTRSILPEEIYVTQKQAVLWGAFLVILLPAAILTIGIMVRFRRRKR